MIKVKNVRKKFVKHTKDKKKIEFYANDNISFEANKGEIVGILGPNGAGKTTLLRMLAGIMEPTEGELLIAGLKMDENPLEIKQQIAFLSGNTKLYEDLSTYELLKMCGEYYSIPEDILEKRIEEISKTLDLTFLHQRIGTLSVGQTQRAGIARCLVHNPEYYILDEATSGLDIMSSKSILEFIKRERDEGKCILYSTHYMEEAENICDRIVLIHKGYLLAVGTPDEIKKKTKTTNVRDAFFALVGGADNEE